MDALRDAITPDIAILGVMSAGCYVQASHRPFRYIKLVREV